MRDLLKVVLSLVLAMASGQALADLPIVLVDEARLPYDYSPSITMIILPIFAYIMR